MPFVSTTLVTSRTASMLRTGEVPLGGRRSSQVCLNRPRETVADMSLNALCPPGVLIGVTLWQVNLARYLANLAESNRPNPRSFHRPSARFCPNVWK
jgi:hypothetical protein